MKKDKKFLGILGGGQLARMMTPTLEKWDLSFCILDQNDCVAGAFTNDLRVGDFRNERDVLMLSDCERVTFDLEDISLLGIQKLEAQGVKVFPPVSVMETIQDKGKQKTFFHENEIPTANFKIINSDFDLLPTGFVKKCTGGYDGKGVFSWKGQGDYPEDFKTDVIWEERIEFVKELSVLTVRGVNGEIKVYDPVEMVFNEELNLIDFTLSPAIISSQVKKEAVNLAQHVTEKLDHVGVLAIEMFLLKEGTLLVNELAPRPHNSGHHSIESCVTDQFENHLRAVSELPLGSTHQLSDFALTYNVLGSGEAGVTKVSGLEKLLAQENVHVHLYGKKECRLGRKMGHVTILGTTEKDVKEKYSLLKNLLKVEGI